LPLLKDILAKGYFPAELPPCFTTTTFASACSFSSGTPKGFHRPAMAQLCNFSLAKAGNARFRRRLSLVNPINFFQIATAVASNWTALERHMQTSALSMSRAVYRPNKERALSHFSYSRADHVDRQAKDRGTAKALLVADISEFYHSIYTHSISWALHTKAIAKTKGRGRLGDRLDHAIQNAQHGQTVGIPIGPDTSLVIAEVILSSLETNLRPRIPFLRGSRFVDDFTLAFPDYASAENALAILQEELLQFELRLNPRKTSVQLLPVELEPEWVSELRKFEIRNTSGQRGDLIGYFDLMTRFLLLHPNDHVSKYGLQRFKQFQPRPTNVPLYQSLLCHIGVVEPGSIKEVVHALLFLRSNNANMLDTQVLQETLNTVISGSTPIGHHYEAAWALWAAMQFRLPLDKETIAILGNTENSLLAILACDAHAKGLAPHLDMARWASRMNPQDLRGEEWLLSYEANVQGWLGTLGGGDHVTADPEFGLLKANAVRFYVP
jgi:hypothetical protein